MTLSRSVAGVLDVARQVLTDIGIRPYRAFLVVETWSGAVQGEGTVTRSFEEILPSPRVRGSSGFKTPEAGGQRLTGQFTLHKISQQKYTREQLKGMLPDLTRRPPNEAFRIGLLPRGQALMQLYVPGEPIPGKDEGWQLKLEAAAQAIPFEAEATGHDVMAELAVTAVDTSRQILTELGLREWRVFLVTESWSGAQNGEGTRTVAYTEVEPAPRIRFVSDAEEMMSGGRRQVGDAVLERISRSMTREQLAGKQPNGMSAPVNESFYWGLEPRDSDGSTVQLYKVGSEPILTTFGWSITLQPTSIRESHA